MERTIRHVITDESGSVTSVKVEKCEWNPPKIIHSGTSQSAREVMNLKIGEIKRIYHPDLICNQSTGGGKRDKKTYHTAISNL